MKELLVILSLLVSLPFSLSSAGERTPQFIRCWGTCVKEHCRSQVQNRTVPLHLQLLGWQCNDECKYDCMHEVTQDRIAQNKSIQQYFGKWPFIRIMGIQEPASVLFSMANGLAHYLGWQKYKSVINPDYDMYSTWRWYCYVCINAWFWSVVFHIRDIDITEKLDYFSAASMIMFALYCFFVRTLGPRRTTWCRVIGTLLLSLYGCHVYYLGFVKFDYGYNMKASVSAGVIYTLSWLLWCAKNAFKRSYVWKCALLVLAGSLSAALELFDFPPLWWILDAHAIWHLSTIPVCYFWYSYLIDDALYEMNQKPKKVE